ncbi:MAG TPA: linear amide C-N hydrolase [Ignavibacteriaceae bacterium]|nr:linear amide C-N hydrolase [Ignavibacteriaceae bacterium]
MKYLIYIALLLSIRFQTYAQGNPWQLSETNSCSTILFNHADSLFVGHNLDESYEVPGLVIVNPHGVTKREVSFADFDTTLSKSKIQWKSKYGSIVYSNLGKEFIDGGMNEAGLYIGEMSLANTKYIKDSNLIKMTDLSWMQYILDNFESVNEVIKDLSHVTVDGPSLWHFFVSDKTGDAAIIEFIDGKLIVYRKNKMPVLALCNTSYRKELGRLRGYSHYGGNKKLDLNIEGNDTRFLWAAVMLYDSSMTKNVKNPIRYTFKILKQLSGNSNQWSIVYDLKKMRMYFNTNNARQIRYIDFSDFDFSKKSSVMVLDIRRNLEGNVSKYFLKFNDYIINEYIDKFINACPYNDDKDKNRVFSFFSNSAKEIVIKK